MKSLEKIVSLAKQRGFIYPGSEIYGGLAGTWDYGPHGVALKNAIKDLWWKHFVVKRSDIYGIDAAILMNQKVWQTSGHVNEFSDPLVECDKCKRRFREDHLERQECPECGGNLGESRQFNMMFETRVGASTDSSAVSYLRPETAQGIFTNFKNIVDSMHPKMPFGIAQIGKAFRNEISARDFIFRDRELEQMEIEWFTREENWEESFEFWRKEMWSWIEMIGLSKTSVHELEIPKDELAHYSKRTIDFEYDYPFGRSELYGLAYRTDHDLSKHMEASNVDLNYIDQSTGEKIMPHVIEPSMGVERTILAVLLDAYTEEEVDGEKRVVLKLNKRIAPVTVAVLPLMKKGGLSEKAKEIYDNLRSSYRAIYDGSGSIGKRYRRQDEIGTPYCITIDQGTLKDNTVTVRDRDSMEQKRVKISDLKKELKI